MAPSSAQIVSQLCAPLWRRSGSTTAATRSGAPIHHLIGCSSTPSASEREARSTWLRWPSSPFARTVLRDARCGGGLLDVVDEAAGDDLEAERLVGALEDRQHASVDEVAADRVLLGVAEAAVDL